MANEIQDTPERRMDAARTFIAMEGGFESMIGRGTHLSDLSERILLADPATTDLTSLYQLMELSDRMVYREPSQPPTREVTPSEPYIAYDCEGLVN